MNQSSIRNPFNMKTRTYVLSKTEAQVRARNKLAVMASGMPLLSVEALGS